MNGSDGKLYEVAISNPTAQLVIATGTEKGDLVKVSPDGFLYATQSGSVAKIGPGCFTSQDTGSITICKQTDPDLGPDASPEFGFDDTQNSRDVILHDDQCFTDSPLNPGTYNFSEPPQFMPPGWTLTNIVCTGGSSVGFFRSPGQVFVLPFFRPGDTGVRINLASGQNVICTFFNTYFPCAVPGGSNISTGIHTTGTGYGLVDPIWTVSAAPPPAPTGAAFAVEPVNAPGTWAAPPVGTNWIDPNNTGGPNPGSSAPSDPEGLYEYVTSFSIPAGPLVLNINYAADNSVFFTLTGPSPSLLGPAFTRGDPAFHTPLKSASYFNPSANAGIYTLHAFVTNNLNGQYPGNGNPTGLLVAGTVRCTNTDSVGGIAALTVSSSASPVPWAPLAAAAIGVLAVLAVGGSYARRRWRA